MIKSRLLPLALCVPFLAATQCIESKTPSPDNLRGLCPNVTGTETAGSELGVNDITLGKSDVAQSFIAGANTSVSSVSLRLTAIAPTGDSVTGTLTARIQPDNAGQPVSQDLASATLDASTVDLGSFGDYSFRFESSAALEAGKRYWLRLSANYGANGTNLVKWAASSVNPSASGGASYYEDSSSSLTDYHTWSTFKIGATRDLLFAMTCAD